MQPDPLEPRADTGWKQNKLPPSRALPFDFRPFLPTTPHHTTTLSHLAGIHPFSSPVFPAHRSRSGRLFLLGIFSVGLLLLSLRARTDKSGVRPGTSQLGVRILLALGQVARGDLLEAVLQADTGVNREGGSDLGRGLRRVLSHLDILRRAVEFLVLAGFPGEEDQAGLVGLEAGDVEGKSLLRGRLAARVDGNTDGGCELAGDAGFLCVGRKLSVILTTILQQSASPVFSSPNGDMVQTRSRVNLKYFFSVPARYYRTGSAPNRPRFDRCSRAWN